jgi:dTDP-4-dehydrorhamnose reductase
MKKILITGAYGQLGSEMKTISGQNQNLPYEFIFTDVDTLNICNESEVDSFFKKLMPDFIVNCAAYTAVDKAEEDQANAYLVNKDAVRLLGEAAEKYGAKMIHVSTDYVFDGKSYLPYTEDMALNPQTLYGRSKAEGEADLQQVCRQAVIIRTSWLYSSFGNNFVKTMLKLGNERESLNVVFDQIGTPTYAADLAKVIMQVIKAKIFVPGIYHFSNEGVCSWYDFAIAIHKYGGVKNCKVLPIESKDYPAKTPRPHYSVLNKAKIKTTYHIEIPHWEDGLIRCLKLL